MHCRCAFPSMPRDNDPQGMPRLDSPESNAPRLEAVVERYDGRSDQCTIYPADAEEMERMTTWITAEDPAFVAVSQLR